MPEHETRVIDLRVRVLILTKPQATNLGALLVQAALKA